MKQPQAVKYHNNPKNNSELSNCSKCRDTKQRQSFNSSEKGMGILQVNATTK